MIEISHISKSFEKGSVNALQDVSIRIEKGELFGLIGPDGAGKTSLFRILATLLLPDEGTASINGLDVVRDYLSIRHRIGYMPGRFSLYQDLSVEENLEFYAAVFGASVEENYEQIKPIYSQIEPFRTRRAGALSGGMKQKLALCCALVHRPEVLLLDEPTTGVDPVSRKEFWDMLAMLKGHGLTIVVSTPYMDEANRCDRIALIQKGQILEQDKPENIVNRHGQNLYQLYGPRMAELLAAARQWSGTLSCFAFGDSHHLSLAPGAKSEELQHYLQQQGFKDIHLSPIKPGIEDVFIELLI
ncbi:MAG: ABC transporter ATP-binding protein [Saprospiraceae bacterium]|nr:ABC transporter ATP-binding protein [Saprospiraceae bacterium]